MVSSDFQISIPADGKNAVVQVTGFLKSEEPFKILDLSQLKGQPKAIRLDSITFLIEEKAGIKLWWEDSTPGEMQLIFPLESRGFFDFGKSHPIHSPRDCLSIYASGFNLEWKNGDYKNAVKSFFLMLDMEKQ